MKTNWRWLVGGCVLLTVAVEAAEPWSDDGLPVQEGLEFWFDCSVQNAARQSLQLPSQATDNGTDFLFDGSGRARHLAQAFPEARPRFRREGSAAFLSFEASNDALLASHLRGTLTNATAFVVAAPRSNRGGFRAFFGFGKSGMNDYVSGLNFDFGPQASTELSFINLEGAGMGGAVQLLRSPPLAFGSWHVFTLSVQSGPGSVALLVDGQQQ